MAQNLDLTELVLLRTAPDSIPSGAGAGAGKCDDCVCGRCRLQLGGAAEGLKMCRGQNPNPTFEKHAPRSDTASHTTPQAGIDVPGQTQHLEAGADARRGLAKANG